jgi:hypothetical protein
LDIGSPKGEGLKVLRGFSCTGQPVYLPHM